MSTDERKAFGAYPGFPNYHHDDDAPGPDQRLAIPVVRGPFAIGDNLCPPEPRRRSAGIPPSPMHIAGGVGAVNLDCATVLRRAEQAADPLPAAAAELVDEVMRAAGLALPASARISFPDFRERVTHAVRNYAGTTADAARNQRALLAASVLRILAADRTEPDIAAKVMDLLERALTNLDT